MVKTLRVHRLQALQHVEGRGDGGELAQPRLPVQEILEVVADGVAHDADEDRRVQPVWEEKRLDPAHLGSKRW